MDKPQNTAELDGGLQSLADAAKFLGCSRSHVYNLIAEGMLPSVKIGKMRRVPIDSVRKLAESNLVNA